MKTSTSTLTRWLLVLLPLLILAGLACWYWPRPRAAVYSLYRERGRVQSLTALEGYESKSSQHFVVYFTKTDRNVADLILQTAESVYQPAVTQMAYRPAEQVPLIVYSSRDELRHAFGWGNSESAVGVYWSGTIRLLSPNVWIQDKRAPQQERAYQKLNPIAHEFTHYLLDYMTNGNYPRWFTEGLAQWVEHRITGYLWIEAGSTLEQKLYTMNDLTVRFDQLQNQPLAYRESYLLIDYIARNYGEESIAQLVHHLQAGQSFANALQQVTGSTEAHLYDQWLSWAQDHLNELDAAK